MKKEFSLIADFTKLFKYMENRMGDIWRGVLTGISDQLSMICTAALGAYAVSLAVTGRSAGEIGALLIALAVMIALANTSRNDNQIHQTGSSIPQIILLS